MFGARGSSQRRQIQQRYNYLRHQKEVKSEDFLSFCKRFGSLSIQKETCTKSIEATDDEQEEVCDSIESFTDNEQESFQPIAYTSNGKELKDKKSTSSINPGAMSRVQFSPVAPSNTHVGKNSTLLIPFK